jgi:serine phosphatase RsbU (regulator of sigma subunit)
MEVQIAVAKIKKYAVSKSGDTVEVVERPQGGMSVVLADGQSSGRGAKWISTLVVRKVITLLAEGVRDGAAARAASDSLYTERGGKVSATLNILSVDSQSKTIVVTRNNPVPALLICGNELRSLGEESQPIGLYRGTRPVINEIPLDIGLTVIVFTDGLVHAGDRYGNKMEIDTCLQALIGNELPSATDIANSLIDHALMLDQNRPTDDISVVVLQVVRKEGDDIRRMSVRLPLSKV